MLYENQDWDWGDLLLVLQLLDTTLYELAQYRHYIFAQVNILHLGHNKTLPVGKFNDSHSNITH